MEGKESRAGCKSVPTSSGGRLEGRAGGGCVESTRREGGRHAGGCWVTPRPTLERCSARVDCLVLGRCVVAIIGWQITQASAVPGVLAALALGSSPGYSLLEQRG